MNYFVKRSKNKNKPTRIKDANMTVLDIHLLELKSDITSILFR